MQPMSNRSGGSHPAHNYHNSSSVGDSRSFEPSPARPRTVDPTSTVETQEEVSTTNREEVDYSSPSNNSQSEGHSQDSPSLDHGNTFEITLKSPEPTDISVNQQFEVSMQH